MSREATGTSRAQTRLEERDTITALHSVPSWLPQTQTWLYNHVRLLPPSVTNHIVCETAENLDQFDLPNVHSLSEAASWRYYWDKGLRGLGTRRYLGLLVRVAKRQGVDLLHSHFGSTGWVNTQAAERVGFAHVVTFYGQEVNHYPRQDPRWYDRYRELFEKVDRVLCEGPHMASCVAALGCPEGKIRVHRLGILVDGIPFRPREWNPEEPLRVLIAASFREKKGIPDALEALGRLQHQVPLEITVIGDASKEPRTQEEKEKILAIIEKHDLWPKIRLLGYQPQDVLFREAYEHHIFLSPSVTAEDGDTEGGAPVGIIEMAATGMPVISTRHCDIPGVLRDGVTGLLADEGDVEGLVTHLRWLVEHPQRWSCMLEAGHEHIAQHFDVNRQAAGLEQVYREVLAERGG